MPWKENRLQVVTLHFLYVRGFLVGGSYEEIPLERNAYLLDGAIKKNPLCISG